MINLTVAIDIEYDLYLIPKFLEINNLYGATFKDNILELHPKLSNKNINTSEYIREYYKNYEFVLKESAKNISLGWDEVKFDFENYITETFQSDQILKNKYDCFLSIVNTNSRFVEENSFQVYYRSKIANQTIAHELGHFAFFDYCDDLIEGIETLDKDNGVYWAFSEIVNSIILSTKEAKRLLNSKGDITYPYLSEYSDKIFEIFMESKEFDKFIMEGFKYLKENFRKE